MEPYYDSDEGIGAGPITFREEKAYLTRANFITPQLKRRATTNGRLQTSTSTEYFTATDSSFQSKTAAISTNSSMEDTNGSIKDAVDEVIRTLDNETADVIELSDEEESDGEEIINISSSSSSSSPSFISEENLEPSVPKFKINSPTCNLRQPSTLSAQNSPSNTSAKFSEKELLKELSILSLSHKGSPAINSADESFLLRSECEIAGSSADDEEEVIDVDSNAYCTAGDSKSNQSDLSYNLIELNGNVSSDAAAIVSPVLSNSGTYNTHRKTDMEHSNNVESKNGERQDQVNVSESIPEIVEPSENTELFNSTLERIDLILSSGGAAENLDFETPKRVVVPPKAVPKSAPTVAPFKVPTKIPCSLRKALRSPRSKFDNIKSPVAHYIKNSGTAPIQQRQPCGELSQNQVVALMNIAPTIELIQWPKITLTEKSYNSGAVQNIAPGYKSKILKLPANIAAITIDMGTLKRHVGPRGMSRLPVPEYIADIDLHGTLVTEVLPCDDVSLITEKKVIID